MRWSDDKLVPDTCSPKELVVAQSIDVESLRLPDRAGLLDTARLLPREAAHMFADFEARLLPAEAVLEPLLRQCLMVSPARESDLRHRLLATGMAVLLLETEIARRSGGRLLLNGCFGVPHAKGMRAIFD